MRPFRLVVVAIQRLRLGMTQLSLLLYMNVMKSIMSHFYYAQPGAVFQDGGIFNALGWREKFQMQAERGCSSEGDQLPTP